MQLLILLSLLRPAPIERGGVIFARYIFCLNEVINMKKYLVLYTVLRITDFLKEVQHVSESEIEDDSFQMTGFSDDEDFSE